MNTNHTATPWKTEDVGDDGRLDVVAFHEGEELWITSANYRDAKFMVTACNAHDDLVEACKRLIGSLNVMCVDGDSDTDIQFAKDVLAKAGAL